jgi:hypothetical protein
MTLVLAALVLSFASCSDGSAAGNDDDGPAGFNAVGTWKCVSWTYGSNPFPYDDRWVFKSDKTYECFENGKLTDAGN